MAYRYSILAFAISISLFILSGATVQAQLHLPVAGDYYDSLGTFNLRGPVKSLRIVNGQRTIMEGGDTVEGQYYASQFLFFDEHGRVIEDRQYSGPGKPMTVRKITYDDAGRPVLEETHGANPQIGTGLLRRATYRYDAQGRLADSGMRYEDGVGERYVYRYETNRVLEERYGGEEQDKAHPVREFFMGADGVMLGVQMFGDKGEEAAQRIEVTYDTVQHELAPFIVTRQIETTYYKDVPVETSILMHVPSRDDMLLEHRWNQEEQVFGNDTVRGRMVSTVYGRKGLAEGVLVCEDGGGCIETRYQYNRHDDLTAEVTITYVSEEEAMRGRVEDDDRYGTPETFKMYKITYDDQGNWTENKWRKGEYQGEGVTAGEVIPVTRREIGYYE